MTVFRRKKFPRLKIVISEIDSSLNEKMDVIPGMGEFGDRQIVTKGFERNKQQPIFE